MYIIFFFLLVFLLPIGVNARLYNIGEFSLLIKASYAGGVLSYSRKGLGKGSETLFRLLGVVLYRKHKEDEDGNYKERDKGKDRGNTFSSCIRNKKFIGYLLRAVREVIKTTVMKKMRARLKLGFEDPAYTGITFGIISCFSILYGEALDFEPDFSGETLEVDFSFKGVIIPMVLAVIGIKYLFIIAKNEMLSGINLKGGKKYGHKG